MRISLYFCLFFALMVQQPNYSTSLVFNCSSIKEEYCKTVADCILLDDDSDDDKLIQMLHRAKDLEQNRKYKSAVDMALEVQRLARLSNKDIIYVKAIDIEMSARKWFDFGSFYKAILHIDKHIQSSFGRTEILLRTFKIAGYSNYYRNNKSQFNQNIDDGVLNKLPVQWSKIDFLKLINKEVSYLLEANIDDFLSESEIKMISQFDAFDGAYPSSLIDRALLTAINSINSFDGDYQLSSQQFYQLLPDFIKSYKGNTELHPMLLKAKYYAILLNRQTNENATLKNWLDLQRLQDLFNKDNQYNKLAYYEEALQKHVNSENSTLTVASQWLSKIYKSYAEKSFAEKNEKAATKWQNKAVRLCEEAIKKYPESNGVSGCKDVLQDIKSPSIGIEAKESILPNQPFAVNISYKNQEWVKISAYQVKTADYLKFLNKNTRWTVDETKLVWSKTILLPNEVGIFSRSATAVLPTLKPAYYVLVAEPEKNVEGFKSPQLFVSATHISCITKPQNQSTLTFVDDFVLGSPLKHFNVTLIERRYDKEKRVSILENKKNIEGRKGFFSLDKSDRADFISISSNGDTLITRFSHNYIREAKVKKRKLLRIFTDRSIYRPGQLVHFKGVNAEQQGVDFNSMNNLNLTILLLDTDYKTIDKQKVTTNKLGSFWGVFKIPESARPGRMQVKTDQGSAYFEVQKYKRPLFDAEWVPIDKPLQPGEEVSLKLLVKSFAGQPLQNADVKTVVKFYSRAFRFYPFFSNDMVVQTLNGKTNQNGEAKISFVSNHDSDQRYIISSIVTTSDGSMREFNYVFNISSKPLVIEFVNQKHIQPVDTKPEVIIRGINGEEISENILIRVKPVNIPTDYFYEMTTGKSDTVLLDKLTWEKYFPGASWSHSLKFESLSKGNQIYSKEAAGNDLRFLDGLKLKEGVYAFEFWVADTLYSAIYQGFSDAGQSKTTLPEPFILTVDNHAPNVGNMITMTLASRFSSGLVKLFVTDKDGVILDKVVEVKPKKVNIPFEVKSRSEGKINIQAYMVRNGQLFEVRDILEVKPASRVIDIEFESIRDCIDPGEKEVWKLKLKREGKILKHAEVLASMYDMSLDEFVPHQWQIPFRMPTSRNYFMHSVNHNLLRDFVYSWNYGGSDYSVNWSVQTPFDYVEPLRSKYARSMVSDDLEIVQNNYSKAEEVEEDKAEKPVKNKSIRTNFNETAFFYPNLKASEEGIVELKFTAPESMSRWKLQVLAHDDQMAVGYANYEVITRKPLMVIPNKLRFVHQGDKVTVLSTVFNTSEDVITVQPNAKVINPVTGKLLETQLTDKSITINPKQSKVFGVSFNVPENVNVIQYLVSGKSGKYTDGELHQILVFPSKQHIVNSLALWNKPNDTKKYEFKPLSAPFTKTSSSHKLSIEMTTNPLWFAIKAIPTIYETSVKSAVNLAQNFYVAAKVDYILKQYPEIKNVLKVWEKSQPQALKSQFYKNKDLKNLIIGQTPWETISEKEEMQRAVLLEMLNENFVNENLQSAIANLESQQLSDGAFSWRPGMQSSWYFTLQTSYLLSQTVGLSTIEEDDVHKIIKKAVKYLDSKVELRYEDMLQHKIDTTNYVTSTDLLKYFQIKLSIDKKYKPKSSAQHFFMNHSTRYKKMGLQQLVLSGVINMQGGNQKYANLVIDLLRQRAVIDKENGIYWHENKNGWSWEDAPIVTQSLIIQFFHQMKQPKTEIEAMKMWLILQKQGQAWYHSRSSLAAIDALLTDGQKWMENKEPVKITIGDLFIHSEKEIQEAGTGYFRKEIGVPTSEMNNVKVENKGVTPIWGSVYYSYNESFEAIKPWQDILSIERELFVIKTTEKGEELHKVNENTELKKGSRVRVQLTIRNKRNLEYVAITSPHAACFEPIDQMSGYRWNGRSSYYKESHESELRFFFDKLIKGNAIITYDLYVERAGTYSAGAAEIQSVYAPEFGANSTGYRINIEK